MSIRGCKRRRERIWRGRYEDIEEKSEVEGYGKAGINLIRGKIYKLLNTCIVLYLKEILA